MVRDDTTGPVQAFIIAVAHTGTPLTLRQTERPISDSAPPELSINGQLWTQNSRRSPVTITIRRRNHSRQLTR